MVDSKELKIKLGIDTGFAINRYPEAGSWIKIVGEVLNLRYVKHVADLLNPFLPDYILKSEVKKIRRLCARYRVTVDTTFTSAFTRVNHLLHPDPEVRKIWFEWFKRYFYYSRELGARGSGGHFGIFSVPDFNDLSRRRFIFEEGIKNWQRLSDYGKKLGFDFLIFEPMSVPRECASTIRDTRELLERVNSNAAIPIRLCMDVDHGNLHSRDPKDTDPYAWLREFGPVSPVIHIKQSSKDKSGHWPFTKENNKKGIIRPQKVIKALKESGAKDVVLLFEFSFRERYPQEYRVIHDLKESVAYWRKYVKM